MPNLSWGQMRTDFLWALAFRALAVRATELAYVSALHINPMHEKLSFKDVVSTEGIYM